MLHSAPAADAAAATAAAAPAVTTICLENISVPHPKPVHKIKIERGQTHEFRLITPWLKEDHADPAIWLIGDHYWTPAPCDDAPWYEVVHDPQDPRYVRNPDGSVVQKIRIKLLSGVAAGQYYIEISRELHKFGAVVGLATYCIVEVTVGGAGAYI